MHFKFATLPTPTAQANRAVGLKPSWLARLAESSTTITATHRSRISTDLSFARNLDTKTVTQLLAGELANKDLSIDPILCCLLKVTLLLRPSVEILVLVLHLSLLGSMLERK